jgi:hypothetical protein
MFLVKISAKLVIVSSFETLTVPAATASQLQWYAMLWCFLVNVDLGHVVFLQTAALSQSTFVGPSISPKNICNL